MSRACAIVITVVCFLGAARYVRSDAPKKELAELQGQWRITHGVKQGEVAKEDDLKMAHAIIAANKLSFLRTKGAAEKAVETMSLVIEGINATKNPKTIDLQTVETREKLVGIYKLEKGVLTLCVDIERPTAFESKVGSFTTLYVLTREPKK
jgi:uncharacterized protein (TIGR03067 family)